MSTPESVLSPATAPEIEELISLDVDANADVQPRIYINRLTPASNVNFWSRQDFTVFSSHALTNPNNSANVVTINWNFTAYIYTTGAVPSLNDFNGAIYIVLVHRGDINSTLMNIEQDVTLTIRSNSATPQRQLPTHSVENGSNWPATIEYRQRMQMFRNNATEIEPFEAEYVHSYQLYRMEQSGRTFNDRLEIHYRPLHGSAWQTPREVNGLSVFRNTNLRQFPLSFTFGAVARFGGANRTVTRNVSVPLGFPLP